MNHKKNRFRAIPILAICLCIVTLISLGYVGYTSFSKNKTSSTKAQVSGKTAIIENPASNGNIEPTQVYSMDTAVSFSQNTYTSYLNAIKRVNESNMNNPDTPSQTLPQAGLDAIKNNVSPDLYSRIKSSEQLNGGDKFGCALYQVDHYIASPKVISNGTAVITIGIFNSMNENNGTITINIDLKKLLIVDVICPSN